MKRFLFPALVLCAALALACQSPNDNNTNRGTNQNAANTNQGPSNVNAPTTPTPNPNEKTVTITVSPGRKITVNPDPVILSKSAGQSLQFVVEDKLTVGLTEVKIEFKSAGGNPMNGPYSPVVGVGAGTQTHSNRQPLRPGVANGKYKYTITVTVAGEPPIVLDPEVEVAT